MTYRPDKCGDCGDQSLEIINTDNNIRIDIPFIPEAEVTNHRVDTCRCLDCGRETVPETGLINGTSLGPNLLKIIVDLWKMNASYQGIADLFSGLFCIGGCAKSTILHAPDAVADHMCTEAGGIAV